LFRGWQIEIPQPSGRDLVQLDENRSEAQTKGQILELLNGMYAELPDKKPKKAK